jgi:HK97 family phage portal protein
VTVAARQAQKRAQAIGMGGWGGWSGDPSAIPPASAFNMATAGVVVNERTVLSLMVVASCIRVLGDAIANVEVHVHRQTGNRRSKSDPEVDPPDVIVDPYADMDREDGDFRLVASLGLNGNLYKHVMDRDKKDNPTLIEVLNPSMIKVQRIDGHKVYTLGAGNTPIPSADIIHVPWISLAGGLVGLNPIEMGVTAFGTGLASQEYASRYFSQGMHPTGLLSIDKPLRPEDADKIKNRLQTQHGGLAQSHTPIVLDASAKWQQISITPETAQLLQTRQFSRAEIAGFYGVPKHLVGDDAGQGGPWGKGLQEEVISFTLFGLNGYSRRLDRADTALLPPGYYVRRKMSDLFKTNDQVVSQFVLALRSAAVATPNDARELIGLPKSDEPGADSIWGPLNSAHNDWLAAGQYGPESGLPGGLNPMGSPDGAPEGGAPTPDATSAPGQRQQIHVRPRIDIHSHFDLHQQGADIRLQAPPPAQVHVEPHISIEQPDVTVGAPDVHVEVAAPPAANVEVNVPRQAAPNVVVNTPEQPATPRRRVRKTVERDQAGKIIAVTEEET